MANTIYFCDATGPYAAFSNYFERTITIEGKDWPSSEHFFQAQKFTSLDYQEEIRKAPSPGQSKVLGYAKRPDFRSDWGSVKDNIMKKGVLAKFTQHEDLKKILLETGDAEIVEDNKDDAYWGNGGRDGKGLNKLGVILMEVRKELKK
eukprot:TRINITY_DN1438_c0_g1_i1.p1 TRINITY_DN1438_c0_g1~~TRINITY_DN1438_c0_g1_i1.p1  ORF type:complete len:162 (+),score=44.01 TRINITY_DN1438_c0_g1_i1:45-488(+)